MSIMLHSNASFVTTNAGAEVISAIQLREKCNDKPSYVVMAKTSKGYVTWMMTYYPVKHCNHDSHHGSGMGNLNGYDHCPFHSDNYLTTIYQKSFFWGHYFETDNQSANRENAEADLFDRAGISCPRFHEDES